MTFSIYSVETGGAPLWSEMQNVVVAKDGHYTAWLGQGKVGGVPTDLFNATDERWLGITVEGRSEAPRLRFVSVPYALHAEEAERLAGRLPSDFISAEQLRAEVQRELQESQRLNSAPAAASGGGVTDSTGGGPTTFVGVTSDQIVLVQQVGGGYALHAVGPGTKATIFGESNGAAPAVSGASNPTSGSGVGVFGSSPSPSGTGVRGEGNSPSGSGIGVYGVSRSAGGAGTVGGTGVLGEASASSGTTFGVRGKAVSPNGTALYGQEIAGSGPTVGVLGSVSSPTGTAGLFNNAAGGKILKATSNWNEMFSVSANGDTFVAGNLTANTFSGSGANLTGVIKSLSAGAGIQLSGNSSTPTIGLDPAFVATLNTNAYSGDQTAPSFTAVNSLSASTNPGVNGQFAVMPDDQDIVHSVTKQAGSQMHLRLSRAVPDAGGGQHFLISPYKFGTAVEYGGVIEVWSTDLSVHGYAGSFPNFWVDDELDGGGLYVAGRVFTGTNGYVRLAADKFGHTSHGTMRFQVRNPEDEFLFQSGPYDQEQTMIEIRKNLTAYIQANALQVRSPSVVTAVESDEQGLRGLIGTRTAHLLDIIVGDQTSTPAMRIFPNGDVSVGNNFDHSVKLSVGSAGGFQVADSGAVTIGTTGTPITRHASATALLSFGSVTLGTCEVQNIPVAGATDGDTVALGVPQALAGVSGVVYFGWVSANDTVSVRLCNFAGGNPVAIPGGTVRADVWKH